MKYEINHMARNLFLRGVEDSEELLPHKQTFANCIRLIAMCAHKVRMKVNKVLQEFYFLFEVAELSVVGD